MCIVTVGTLRNKHTVNDHILHSVFSLHRDPRPAYQNVVRMVQDVNIRLQNWDILLKNIRAYYTVSKNQNFQYAHPAE